MAKVSNPRKKFKYNIIIPGLNPFYAQKVKSPDIEFEPVEHGESGGTIKTAGMEKIGMLTLSKISSASAVDNFIYEWRKLVKTGIPNVYKKNIVVEQLGNDGDSVLNSWVCKGSWPQKINGLDFDSMASENTVEDIEFCVDEVTHT